MPDTLNVRQIKALPKDDRRPFAAHLLYLKAELRTAKNGKPFAVAHLGDRTGSFTTTCFNDSQPFSFFSGIEPGTLVEVQGVPDYFNDKFSPKLREVAHVPPDKLAQLGGVEAFQEGPDESVDSLEAGLREIVADIPHSGLRATVEAALDLHGAQLRSCPAAIAMHHAYPGGLIEHTTRMARAARVLLPLYPDVDPSLALAGIVLHDFGKILEYAQAPDTGKTRSGLLQGHVVLGYRMARQAALKAKLDEDSLERLEHVILSHQGELQWGAAVMAATPEAVFVSMVDNLDAKMGMVERALRTTPETDAFSEFIPGLQATLLTSPIAHGESTTPQGGSAAATSGQGQAPAGETKADDGPSLFDLKD
ncbi:MAG: 3'-5' exoribonuclease YhaM family protein [Opitutales bacterium]